ncbi:MAG TPA: dicarboxylate/amino acid:cation symporter [Gemmatimonadaceae bacterium]|nr:dicarboxylate/amino acid:cation symporter [Gemmatimonadaceae bacterium]
MIPRSPSARASIGLASGLVVGIAIASTSSPALRSFAGALEPVGTIWVNAIRMTVIPLVVSLLIATIAQEKDLSAMGKLGGRAVAIFVALLSGVALLGFLAGPPLFSLLDVDVASAVSLRGTASSAVNNVKLPSFSSWVVSLVPSNPIQAAAEGAMLPLIIFAVVFAAALARTPPDLRMTGTAFFRGIADAMLVIVGWVLALAPIGVFALAVTIAMKVGVGVAGAVGFYLAVHSGLLAIAGLLLYVVVRFGAGMPVARFARAMLPAQVVAISTRSSVAALPAMIDGAERSLKLPTQITSFALPFGVSVFRLNQGVSWVVTALFIGKLYGIHLGLSQIALLAAASVPMSFSVPGIPSGGLFVIAPFFMTVGLPIEGIGILIALDVIPDLFKTLLNVTGHMTATVLLSRNEIEVAAPS